FLQTPPPRPPSPLSLHDALPIWPLRVARGRPRRAARGRHAGRGGPRADGPAAGLAAGRAGLAGGTRPRPADIRRSRPPAAAETVDRKSTRLNSSHVKISYAVFCL